MNDRKSEGSGQFIPVRTYQHHPRYPELFSGIPQELGGCLVAWKDPVYRAVELKWGHADALLSGKGAFLHGSRWMLPQITPVFYAASTEAVAIKESRQNVKHFGIRKTGHLQRKPRLIVEIQPLLKRVVDLPLLCKRLAWPDIDELLGENWESINARGAETLAQAFGRALWQLKVEGLFCPSSRDRRARNLICFHDRIDPAQLRISHARELEKWLAT